MYRIAAMAGLLKRKLRISLSNRLKIFDPSNCVDKGRRIRYDGTPHFKQFMEETCSDSTFDREQLRVEFNVDEEAAVDNAHPRWTQ